MYNMAKAVYRQAKLITTVCISEIILLFIQISLKINL